MIYAATDKDASHEDDDDDEGWERDILLGGKTATRQSGDSDKLAARLANKQNNF